MVAAVREVPAIGLIPRSGLDSRTDPGLCLRQMRTPLSVSYDRYLCSYGVYLTLALFFLHLPLDAAVISFDIASPKTFVTINVSRLRDTVVLFFLLLVRSL